MTPYNLTALRRLCAYDDRVHAQDARIAAWRRRPLAEVEDLRTANRHAYRGLARDVESEIAADRERVQAAARAVQSQVLRLPHDVVRVSPSLIDDVVRQEQGNGCRGVLVAALLLAVAVALCWAVLVVEKVVGL